MIKIDDIVKHKELLYLSAVVLLVTLIMLYPVINSGYINDDSAESLTKGKLVVLEKNLLEFIKGYILYWIFNYGRFFPLIFYSTAFYTLVNNLMLYKMTVILTVLVNMLLFGYLVKLLTRSTNLGILSTLLVPLLFQFRLYHDPILNYCFLLELVFGILLGSLILLAWYLRGGKKGLYLISLLFFATNLLLYEITYAFCLIPVVLIYFFGKKRLSDLVRLSFPYILLTGVAATIPVALRSYLGISIVGDGQAYVLNMNPLIYAYTFLKQTFAAVPLSYYLIDPNNIFSDPVTTIFANLSLTQIILATGFFILFVELLYKVSKEINDGSNNFHMAPIAILGLSFLLLPGAIISLSPKYQGEVIWGYGYLPVYISYFGMGLLILCVLPCLLKISYSKGRAVLSILIVLLALIFSILGVVNYNNNVLVVEESNLFWLYPRSTIEDGISNNLLGSIPVGSTLLVNSNYPWDDVSFYVKDSSFRPKYVGTKAPRIYFGGGGYNLDLLPAGYLINGSDSDTYRYTYSGSDEVYYLSYWSHSRSDGVALLANVKDISLSNKTIHGVTGSSVLLFIRTPYDKHDWDGHQKPSSVSINGLWANESTSDDFEPFWLSNDQLSLVSSGEKWKMYKLEYDTMVIDVLSLNVNVAPADVQPQKSSL